MFLCEDNHLLTVSGVFTVFTLLCLSLPISKPRESQITVPVTLLRDLCIYPDPPFLHTLHCHLSDCECVVVQVSPALHFLHPVPQWEADACAVPCGGCRGGCQEDAEGGALKPASRPSPAVLFTKPDRGLLPRSQTTLSPLSPDSVSL